MSLGDVFPKISDRAGAVPKLPYLTSERFFEMNQFKLTLVFLITLVSCPQLFAHPGHGAEQAVNPHGILHYLTEPVHLMPFAAIALFVFLVVMGKKMLQRYRDQRRAVVIPREDKQN